MYGATQHSAAALGSASGLLLEFKADAAAPYDGDSNFKGWIKPGCPLLQSVTNRKGRFVGLALRLSRVKAPAKPAWPAF